MYYYVIKNGQYEHYFIKKANEAGLSENMNKINSTDKLVPVEEIFQLLDTKDGGRYLVKLFELKDTETHLVKGIKEYLFSLDGVTDIMEVEKLPEGYKKVSREIYQNMVNNFNDKKELME